MAAVVAEAPPRLLAAGQLFLDLVFADLPGSPRLGEERWTSAFGWGPGGIANYAIAAARLGVTTTVSAAVGEDDLSALARARLRSEGVADATRPVAGWALPVTASLGYDEDRALVTGGTPAPGLGPLLAQAPVTEVACIHLDPSAGDWVRASASRGTRVFADVGWDDTGAWDEGLLDALEGSWAFVPNDREALAYTGADDARSAARALAERVPLSVVTLGSRGVVAVDAATGDEVVCDPVRVAAVDTTGAGDVFGGALAAACLTGWTLRQRIDFASLVAAVTVSRPGGAASAPMLAELVPWLDAHPSTADPARFAFLRSALSPGAPSPFDPRHRP